MIITDKISSIRTREDIMRVGRETSFQRMADFVDVTLQIVFDVTIEGVDETNHRAVGRHQNVPSVGTEFQTRPVTIHFRVKPTLVRGKENAYV